MHYGVVFPQIEFGNDPDAIRDYAQTAEALGYDYLLIYDHVLGANPDRPRKLTGPYTDRDPFHEPLVLFGFLAAVTRRIQLTTGILILPQRQTALVAKQAAEIDILSGGRLRLGVGLGWNHVEYEALAMPFDTRGRRVADGQAFGLPSRAVSHATRTGRDRAPQTPTPEYRSSSPGAPWSDVSLGAQSEAPPPERGRDAQRWRNGPGPCGSDVSALPASLVGGPPWLRYGATFGVAGVEVKAAELAMSSMPRTPSPGPGLSTKTTLPGPWTVS